MIFLPFASSARAQEEDNDYEPCLEPRFHGHLPGPPVFRVLAHLRREAVAEELEARWREFLAGRGTTQFVIDASVRFMEAYRGCSADPEDHLYALESHLQRMLSLERIEHARVEQGRVRFPELRSAVADAKFWLGQTIFEQGPDGKPLPDKVMHRLWIELGSADVAHACRVRWTLQSSGPESAAFLRETSEAPGVSPVRELIAFSDGLGEVIRDSARKAAQALGEPEASRQRRYLRTLDMLAQMDREGGR